MATKRHIEYAQKYIHDNYEQLSIRLKKGERDRYKAVAEQLGISVNQLFVQSVERFIEDNLIKETND